MAFRPTMVRIIFHSFEVECSCADSSTSGEYDCNGQWRRGIANHMNNRFVTGEYVTRSQKLTFEALYIIRTLKKRRFDKILIVFIRCNNRQTEFIDSRYLHKYQLRMIRALSVTFLGQDAWPRKHWQRASPSWFKSTGSSPIYSCRLKLLVSNISSVTSSYQELNTFAAFAT